MSSSAFPQLPIAWLPEPRDHDEDLPDGPVATPPYGALTLPTPSDDPAIDASVADDEIAADAETADAETADAETADAETADAETADAESAGGEVPTSDGDVAPDAPPTDGQTPVPAPAEPTPVDVDEIPLLPFAKVVETYVGWGTRACALAIDLLVLVLPFAAGVLVDSALMAYNVPMIQGQMTVIPFVLAAIVWNRGVWQGRTGQSLGKKAMGIRLADESTDLPVGIRTALLRELAHLVDTLSLVGWLRPLWNGKRRTFADQIVGTVVLG